MFKNQTTIVLGAGASFDHGFPLGPELLSDVVKGFQALMQVFDAPHISQPRDDHTNPTWLDHRYYTLSQRIGSQNKSQLGFDYYLIKDFVNSAQSQTALSIDRFLRDNPRFTGLGRYAIALEICAKSWETVSDGFGRRNLHKRDYSINQNLGWVRNLINRIREGAAGPEELAKNKLTIVTFNYDMSLGSVDN